MNREALSCQACLQSEIQLLFPFIAPVFVFFLFWLFIYIIIKVIKIPISRRIKIFLVSCFYVMFVALIIFIYVRKDRLDTLDRIKKYVLP